jgi:dsDNA-specific endonuclease/ATPase MutS2
LHIENLVKDHSKMSNGEIMKTQLNHFHGYLDEATRLGVQKVFVIHGIGKGKLRNEIATILMRNPDVKTFKNEYHPKYGTGATEVFFD